MKYIALKDLEKHIIHDGCDEGCGYIDERDLAAIPTVDLDKIRAEIEQAADKQFQIAMSVADLNERYTHIQMENAYRHSLNILDKYKAESEDRE